MSVYIGDVEVKSGEKKTIDLAVPGSELSLAVTVICGQQPGKKVLLTAGIHGAEYSSILTALELKRELTPEAVKGSLMILPVANPGGFKAKKPAMVPADGKNLNRMFPGRKDGSLAEAMAYTITTQLQDEADFYLDLHGGDLHESLTPYVYVPGAAREEITKAARRAAAVLKVKYRVLSGATTGAYNSAAIRGVPSLLIERGGSGVWSRFEVDDYKDDVLRVLSHLGVYEHSGECINGSAGEATGEQVELREVFYPCAEYEGFWFPAVKPGDRILKGQLLGCIKNSEGEVLQSCYAETSGVVLYQTVSLAINPGDGLVAHGGV